MYGNNGLNTGAAYMARRGWDKDPSSQGSISFHGSSRKKIFVIMALALLGLLLIAAVVIIILFAVGVINGPVTDLTSSTASPIINPIPPIPIVPTPRNYRCTFIIQRQANAAYNERSSSTYQYANSMLTAALTDTMRASSLAGYNPIVTMDGLTNRGEDLQVDFMLELNSQLSPSTVDNVIRSQVDNIMGRLGGNANIDRNSVRVVSN